MTNLRKLLALVLVAAMTVTMLPVFAAAEDVAVETVQSVADVPAAEAAPVAVEDVAFIPELPQAEASAAAPVEAIETVAAEAVPVKAELQDEVSDSDHAKVVKYDIDYSVLEETGYATIAAAYAAAAAYEGLCEVVVLKDVSYVTTANGYAGFLNAGASSKSAYATWNVENTSDPDCTIHGFWLNLDGHTVTVNCIDYYRSALYTLNAPINVKNGTILYKYNRTNVASQFGVVGLAYASSSGNATQVGTTSELYAPEVTLKGVNAYRVKASASATAGPVIGSVLLGSDIRIIDSKLVSEASNVIYLSKNPYKTTVPANYTNGTLSAAHNIYIKNSTIGSTNDAYSLIYASSISSGAAVGCDLNVNLDGTVNFFGKQPPVTVADGGPTLNFPAAAAYTETTTTTGYPDVASFATATTVDAVPTFKADATYDGRTYVVLSDCPHSTTEHHEAVPATFATTGVIEYWQCTNCLKCFSDAGCTTEVTNMAELTIPIRADASGLSEAEMLELGAIMSATAPDGTVTAYNEIGKAINAAAEWTETGGSVKLLNDYAVKSNAAGNTGMLWNTGKNAAKYHTDSDPLVGTLYGYWIDLGGHTLSVWRPSSIFGNPGLTAVNVKNGTIIYLNADTNVDHSAGIFKAALQVGTSTSVPYDPETHEMITGRITVYNTDIYALPGGTVHYPLLSTYWNSEIRIYDSTILGQYGLSIGKCENDMTGDATALANAQAQGSNNNLYFYGDTVFGSPLGNREITYRTWTSASGNKVNETLSPGTAQGIDHNINVYADPTVKFVGSTAGLVSDNSGSTVTLHVNPPAGCDVETSSVDVTEPSKTNLATLSATTVGFVPTNDEPSSKNCFSYVPHVHAAKATQHEAVAATYAAPGNSEYWSCTCGKFFADAACTEEIAENSWVIEPLSCAHATPEAHAAVAPTYAAGGNSAYWYCPDCLRYFSDETCETEIAENSWVLEKLVDVGEKTDAELVEQGAVAKAVAPDGTAKAYDTLVAAYNEGKTWTEAGGTVLLLKDFYVESDANSWSAGYLTGISADYDNNEVDGMPTKGFWLDLGGHTLDVKLARALVYSNTTAAINMKNGTIIFRDNGRTTSSGGSAALYGAITLGTSGANTLNEDKSVKKIGVNFYKLNFLVSAVYDKSKPAVVSGAVVNTAINIKDSNIISASPQNAFRLYRTTSTATNDALVANGANYVVNVTNSTVGNLNGDYSAIYLTSYDSSVAFTEGLAYTFTVNADNDTTILGYKPYSVTEATAAGYTVTTNVGNYLQTVRSYENAEIAPSAAEYKAWVSPATYVAEDLSGQTTEAGSAKATLTYGENTVYFAEIADAFAAAEKFGATSAAPTLTLNAAPSTYALGAQGASSAFTLDLNGQALPADGLFDPSAASGKTVTVTMASAGEGKLFAGVPAQTFAANDSFIVEKGHFFTDYSLNLEDSVSINLYTRNNVPEKVYYVQEGKEHMIDAPGAENDWVVNTLAAKQMSETIDAYAVKTEGTITYVDYSKGISVENYAKQDGVTAGVTGEELAALTETLQTMQVYGAYAAKFFAGDASALSEDELSALIGANAAPENYVGNLNDEAFAISDGIGNHVTDSGVVNGYYGSAAVLADRLSLKFYFYGEQFEGAAKVTVGGETTDFTPQTSVDGVFKYVEASVAAKDFDTAITVEFEGVGSVTDSISAYTKRLIDKGDASSNLANALRAYGAAAKAYSDAKNAVTP